MQFNAAAPIIDLPEAEWRLRCLTNWPYQASIQFAIPVGIFTDNSPDTNSVAWENVIVEYAGNQYVITAGNTSEKYIYWTLASPYVLSHSATIPTITANLIVVGINTAGEFQPSWKAGQAAVVANTVSATAVDGITITGSTVRTSATDPRTEMNTTDGLFSTNSSHEKTWQVKADGSIWIDKINSKDLADASSFIYMGNDGQVQLGAGGRLQYLDINNASGYIELIVGDLATTTGDLKLSAYVAGDDVIIKGGSTVFSTFNLSGITMAAGDLFAVTAGKGIILKNAAGTVTKRVRLNDAGDGLIFETP